MLLSAKKGFTLAELLIALAILGVIATFTIPKILTSTGTAQYRAVAKEAASIISGAQQDFSINNAQVVATRFTDMLANVNYVSLDVASTALVTGLQDACAAATPCLVLHNGAILQYSVGQAFTATPNYITVKIDPDGTKTASATDIVTFNLFFNGQLRDRINTTGVAGVGGTVLTDQTLATPTWATNLWQ